MREVQLGPGLVQDLLQEIATLTTEIIVGLKTHTQTITLEGTAAEIVEVLAAVIVGVEIEVVVLILLEDMGIMEDRGVAVGIDKTKIRDILTRHIEEDEFCNLIS